MLLCVGLGRLVMPQTNTYLTRFQWNITRSLYQNVYLICNIQPLCSFPYMMFNLISQCMDLIWSDYQAYRMYSSRAFISDRSFCKNADWWATLSQNNVWATCDSNKTYLRGLERRAGSGIWHGLNLIERGKCCSAPGALSNQDSHCITTDWSNTLDR